MSALWIRDGDKLCLRDKPEDYGKILESDGIYPETVKVEFADEAIIEFRQMSPTLYMFWKVIKESV